MTSAQNSGMISEKINMAGIFDTKILNGNMSVNVVL
jgi:hypothetical protein